jgi:hypothetical protein
MQVAKSTVVGDTAKKSKRTSNPSKRDAISEQAITPQSEVDSVDTARNWLNTHGLAGAWLIQLATEINAGALQLGVDLLETQSKCLLSFPGTAQKLNVEPSLFIKTLEEKGWLVTDILSPMRKVQVINQVRGVLLASEPSGFMKQLITVFNLPAEEELSDQPPKLDNQAPVQDGNGKSLQNRTEKPGKVQKLKQKSSANKLQPTDKQEFAETPSSKSTSLKPAPIKPEEFSQPKPQSEAEIAITHKPVKQKAIAAAVAKTAAAQQSTSSTVAGSPAVMTLINHLRKLRPVSEATTADNAWHSVEEPEIAQYLKDHPGLKRSALLREMASHPDFQMSEGCIKVRISP